MKIRKPLPLLVIGALGILTTFLWPGRGDRMQAADGDANIGQLATRTARPPDSELTTNPSRLAPTPEEVFANLPGARVTERESIDQALTEVRHRVSPMPPEAAAGDNAGTLYHAFNPSQRLVARFLSNGLRITPPGDVHAWQTTLSRRTPAGTAPTVVSHGSKVEYHHADGVVEWWNNESGGFRQGFVVPAALQEHGEVRIAIRLEGMSADADPERPGDLRFLQQAGIPLLGYRDLKAWDARQRPLQTRMHPTAEGIELVALTADAVFPVTIDPLVVRDPSILQAPVTGTGRPGGGFGQAFDVGGDQLMVTAMGEGPLFPGGSRDGVLHFFTRDGEGWRAITRLIPPTKDLGLTSSRSIHDNIAILGFPGSDVCVVYERSGDTWAETARLNAPAGTAADQLFGASVAATAHGLLVGSPTNAFGSQPATAGGSVHFYTKTSGTWTANGQIQPAAPPAARFATNIARDGERIVVGSSGLSGTQAGAAHVFFWNGGSWIEEAALSSSVGPGESGFGSTVAIDGDTVAIGIDRSGGGQKGVVAVFQRNGLSAWTQTQRIPEPESSARGFGAAVDLGGDLMAVKTEMGHRFYRRDSGGVWLPLTSAVDSSLLFVPNATMVRFDGSILLAGVSNSSSEQPAGGSVNLYQATPSRFQEVGSLDSGDSGYGNRFGFTLATDGSRLMVRAEADYDPVGRHRGKVFTFKNEAGTWSFESQLIPPAALPTDPTGEFGSSIAIHGDTAVVGNPISFSKGEVHVFEFSDTGWQHVTRFQRADGLSPFDRSADFGRAVAVWGDVIVAGDPGARPPSRETEGMVFAYRKTDGLWVDDGRLAPPAGPLPYALGRSLALQDGRAFVGADRAVHIFERTPAGWSQTARLTAPVFAEFPFGAPLAVSGETLAVGTTNLFDNYLSSDSNGAVHLFHQEAGAWNHQARLAVQASQSTAGEEKSFGDSIALSGDLCLVGATRLVPPGIADYGAVIAFTRTGGVWTREADLFAASRTGESVALAGGFAFVGEPINTAADPGAILNAGLVRVSRVTTPCPVLRVKSAGKILKPNTPFLVPAASPGHPTTVDLVLENAGAFLLAEFRLELTGPDAADFEFSAPQVRELMTGATSAIHVRFSPTATGTRTAELRIHSNACAGPFRLPLSGTSGALPEIAVEHLGHGFLLDGSGQVDFGDTGSGDEGTATFRVSNLGPGNLSKISLKATGPAAKDYRMPKLATVLAAGGTLDFTVTFRPSAPGGRPAVLQLFSSDTDESPFDIPLTGQGVARPEIEVLSGKTVLQDGDTTLDFGAPAAGKRVTRKLTVRNTGWLPLQNLAFSLTGDTAGFALTPPTISAFAPGKSLSLALTYTGPSSGLHAATLVIASNDADETPFEIGLRAGALPATATARSIGEGGGKLPLILAADPEEDSDGDGIGALLEFAFGLDPGRADHAYLTPSRTTGLPRIAMESRDGRNFLRFEFVRRRDGLLEYQPQVTSDLTNYQAVLGPEQIRIINADWERVVIDTPVPAGRPARFFGRVKVSGR